MTRVVRTAVLICGGGLLMATAALASVPDPAHCTLGVGLTAAQRQYIPVGGWTLVAGAGNAAPCKADTCPDRPDVGAGLNSTTSAYTVEIRDGTTSPALNGQPINAANVCIDFSNCVDVKVASDQKPGTTGGSFTCTGSTHGIVCGQTGPDGRYTFYVMGAGNANILGTPFPRPGATLVDPGCASISANLYPLGNLKAVIYDVNGIGTPAQAVTSADASLVSKEVAACSANPANCRARIDMTRDGSLNSADAARSGFMAAQAAAGQSGSKVTGPYCP